MTLGPTLSIPSTVLSTILEKMQKNWPLETSEWAQCPWFLSTPLPFPPVFTISVHFNGHNNPGRSPRETQAQKGRQLSPWGSAG